MDDHAERLKKAVKCFKARRDRNEHPMGEFAGTRADRAWKIDPAERRSCCADAEPSDLGGRQQFIGHWLNKHCRAIAHVAQLHGVSEEDLRKALKAKPAAPGQQDLF